MPPSFHTRLLLVCTFSCLCVTGAQAFILSDPNFQPWLSTASNIRSGNGRPVTLTWSLVGDGTSTPNTDGTRVGSNLINFLDTTFGGTPSVPQADDLTVRPWFTLFEQTFDRWEALSGIDFVHDPYDDNANLGQFSGTLNVRGDIRIGGRDVDGTENMMNTVAFAFPPRGFLSDGDIVLDTSESSYFSNTTANFRRFRNTLAHEIGHSLNLKHVVSSTDNLLLEPSISLSFDGPQLDEVRAVHFFYGDVNEKSNNGLGNDIAARATDLGLIAAGNTTSIGADAQGSTQFINPTATDFVSISNVDDTDFFSFSISGPSLLDLLLTPRGGTFTQSEQQGIPSPFNASARSDLSVSIFDSTGSTLLATIDNTGQGESERLQDFRLLEPGEYFARVTGADDTIQLYQLDLSIDPLIFLFADLNKDARVDADDLTLLENAWGLSAAGDTDNDGDTDGSDFLTWQRQFNGSLTSLALPQAVPEPTSAALLLLGLCVLPRFKT